MARKVWLEVALNGGWTQERQPLIPVRRMDLIEEAVACAQAGASVMHFHSYDEATGRQNDDAATYEDVIRGIQARCDAIIYPTMEQRPQEPDSSARYDPIEALCRKRLLEWSVLDPGSVNFSEFSNIQQDKLGYIYANSELHIRRGLELARSYKHHPSYAIYEPGFIRLGAALYRRMADVPMPIYRFMLTDALAFGMPCEPFALAAYTQLLEREHPGAPWMVAGRCSDISDLIEPTVRSGGHVRVGLEDAPLGTTLRNIDWVNRAVDLIRTAGGEPASPEDIRTALTAR